MAALSWTAVARAGTVLSEEERRGIRDLIVSEQAKISSLWVEFHTIQHENDREARERHYEWAFSSAKRYRKSWWPTPVGSPLPQRWGLAVWDGKVKKAYDSELNNGSLRDKDNWKADEPQTSSPYSRCLGDYSQGTMTRIFAQVPLADWEAQWSDDQKMVTFTTDAFPAPNSAGRSCFVRWVEELGLAGYGLPDDGRLSLLDRMIPVPDGQAALAVTRLALLTASTAGGATMPSIPIPRVSFQGSFIRNLEILAGGASLSRRGKVESHLSRLTWFLGVRRVVERLPRNSVWQD